MKSLFEKSTRDELINRINTVNETKVALWGKMNVFQMVRHCTLWDEMILRNRIYKRVFIGRLLGKTMLRNELKEGSILRPDNPTIPELKVKEQSGDVEAEKIKWISLINEYPKYSLPDYAFVHPFFGEMTKEEIGLFAYKHSDHHLRQFDC